MTHTAASLKSSPNPQILELRILTHHSADNRFEFLKGRYKNTWMAIKAGKPTVGEEKTVVPAVTGKQGGGLTGLMGNYGDSDSEDDSEEGEGAQAAEPPAAPADEGLPPPPPSPPSHPLGDSPDTVAADPPADTLAETQEEVLARRREKAKRWAEARRKAMDA